MRQQHTYTQIWVKCPSLPSSLPPSLPPSPGLKMTIQSPTSSLCSPQFLLYFSLFDVVLFMLGGRVKQAQPFKGFGAFDLGGEFIHGSNTVVNKIVLDNGWKVLPVSVFAGFLFE